MELISDLKCCGNKVTEVRKKYKMNQVEFYNFLFPGNGKDVENIKKKMNEIENGKRKSIDLIFLQAICERCHVSADYILGLDTAYRNHEERFICEYTGLDDFAIRQLHKWATDKNNGADLSVIRDGWIGTDGEREINRAYEKQSAIQFLKIINLLFVEGNKTEKKGKKKENQRFSNLSILRCLYLMCIEKPKRLIGKMKCDRIDEIMEHEKPSLLYWEISKMKENMSLDAEQIIMLQDASEVYYPIDVKDILEQIAKNRLMKDLDWLIEQVKADDN